MSVPYPHCYWEFILSPFRLVNPPKQKTNHCFRLSGWMHWCYLKERKWQFSSFSPCFWGGFTDNQYIRCPVSRQFCRYSGVCRFFRGETFGYPAIHITDVRDTVYSCYTVFPEAFRHQASDVNQYVCMGIPVRFVRLRRSGRRIVDVDSFHDCLWHGV